MKQDKELSQKIIELLEKNLKKKLPEKGVIAGQSVAEAYFRLNNIPIKTRIKDVDLFSYTYNGLSGFYDEKDRDKKINIITFAKTRLIKSESSYGMVNIVSNGKLTIKNVMEKDRVNLVITDKLLYYNKDYEYINSVVDSFDINSIQIGVDLKTKKLYKTKEFDNFIKTKQIEMVNYCSPIPSIARLIEKEETSKNLFLNTDYEIKLAILKILIYKKREIYSKNRGMLMSIERFNKFSNKTKNKLREYFIEKAITIKRNTGDEFNDNLKLIKFMPRNDILDKETLKRIVELKKILGSDFNDSLLTRKFLINLLKKSFINNVKERTDKKIKKGVISDTYIKNNNLLFSYFKDDIFKEKKNDLKIINTHYLFTLSMLPNFTINEIANFIRKMNKNRTVYIIGLHETGKIRDDFIINTDLSNIIKEIEEENKKLNDKYLFKVDPSLIKCQGYEIKQIQNPNILMSVGEEMSHCVGGYWSEMETGNSLIFDIIKDYKKKERWTLELRIRRQKKKKEEESENNYISFNDNLFDENVTKGDNNKNKILNVEEYEYCVNQLSGFQNEEAPKEIKNLSTSLSKKITASLTVEFLSNLKNNF